MQKLAIIVFGAAFLWGGYWFVGSSAVQSGMSAWLDDRQVDGWVAEYSSLETHGFPNRFDTTITDLELADPRSGIAWNVPVLEILALSYQPNHIIARLPGEQVFATPYEKITINSQDMRGSVVFEADTKLALDRSSFVLDELVLTSTLGWQTSVHSGRFHTQKTVAKTDAHDLFFEATDVTPTKRFMARLNPTGLLPENLETLKIDATVGFDAPWDRLAIERARPQITTLHLKLMQAKWGDMDLRAAGELDVDDAGIPTGEITIKAENWREMLNIAVRGGYLQANIARSLENGLQFVANMSGNTKSLDVPLTFKNGRMSFGPIPLGPAPRLAIR